MKEKKKVKGKWYWSWVGSTQMKKVNKIGRSEEGVQGAVVIKNKFKMQYTIPKAEKQCSEEETNSRSNRYR